MSEFLNFEFRIASCFFLSDMKFYNTSWKIKIQVANKFTRKSELNIDIRATVFKNDYCVVAMANWRADKCKTF